jgi:hypothetical protein
MGGKQTKTIEAGYKMVPKSVLIGGQNPVKLMHDELSKGIHHLSEEEATVKAMTLKTAYEYVIMELRRQLQAKQEFVEQMGTINKRSK